MVVGDVQLGGVTPENRPQSPTVTFSLPDSAATEPEAAGVPRDSVKTPARLPVFLMSTVPVAAAPPGFSAGAVRIAAALLELDIDSVPDENVFDGFADEAVKSAPDPTATATAASAAERPASVRLG